MEYKDNKDDFSSSLPLDDIDEFFLKNFNIFLDNSDVKKNENINNYMGKDLIDNENKIEKQLEILDIEENTNLETLDDTKNNSNETIENKIEILDIEDDSNLLFDKSLSENESLEILTDTENTSNDIENKTETLDIEDDSNLLFDKFSSDEQTIEILEDEFENTNSEHSFYVNEMDSDDTNPFDNQNYDKYTYTITKEKDIKEIRKEKTTKLIFINLLIVIFICLAFVIYKIVRWKLDNDSISRQISEVQDSVVMEDIEDNENTIIIDPEPEIPVLPEEPIQTTPDNDYYNFINMPLMSVDLNNLVKRNSDTIGWLKVNGTNINYPVVQKNDNKYYLTHDFDQKYNEAGWVFVDYRNNLVDDKNLIIYGHSRLDKTMFGTLSNITKSFWYNDSSNHLIKLSTLKSNTSWQVFSTYVIPTEEYYIKTNFSSNDEYLEFLNTLKSRSIYNYGVNVNENDRILTLSTCSMNNKKVVLHAKLIKMENR